MQLEAAVLENTNAPLRIAKLETQELKKGQILVKVYYSGMCRSQLMEVTGGRGEDKWLPHLLGHEGSGVVVETGPGVSKVKPGDAVILTWIKGQGIDAPGALYKEGDKIINSGPVTTFSNYTVVSETRVVLKPDNIPFDTAVLYGCALPTGAGMVLNELNISPQSSVVVIGLGGIGIASLFALLSSGVKNIVAVDVSAEKLEAAKSWGVEHCICVRDGELVEKVLKIFEGGVDYCIEASGTVEMIENGVELVRKNGGKLLFASHPPEGDTIRIAPHDLISGKQIAGSWGGAVQPDRDIPKFSLLFDHNKIPLDSLITKRYKLAQINEALADLASGSVFRPIIEMEHGHKPEV